MKNVIIVYAGRFQPFCQHHYNVYKWLKNLFNSRVIIVTSNKVEYGKSPLNFNEKKEFISKFVNRQDIFCLKNLYSHEELKMHINIDDCVLIYAYSAKDINRIQQSNIPGKISYLQPFKTLDQCKLSNEHGYFVITPEFRLKFNNTVLSATNMRKYLSTLKPNNILDFKIFQKIFNITDYGFYNYIINKFK
jgi:hypothetical protein